MKVEQFDNPADFLQALHGKRTKRVAVPRAPTSERTGLSTLLLRGWNVEWNSAMQIRLWRAALDTGFYSDEKACCDCAKALAQSGKLRVEEVVG